MCSSPSSTWTRRAQAFVTRAHRHLWGKNNEDPFVFLYEHGLTHDFAKERILGWNKFGQDRPLKGWGLPQTSDRTKFHLPPGIVVPRIDDQQLLGILIIPMEGHAPPYFVPGGQPMAWGPLDGEIKTFKDPLVALKAVQANPHVRARYNPDAP